MAIAYRQRGFGSLFYFIIVFFFSMLALLLSLIRYVLFLRMITYVQSVMDAWLLH